MKQFEKEYIEFLELRHRNILDTLREGTLNKEVTDVMEKVAAEIAMKFSKK